MIRANIFRGQLVPERRLIDGRVPKRPTWEHARFIELISRFLDLYGGDILKCEVSVWQTDF